MGESRLARGGALALVAVLVAGCGGGAGPGAACDHSGEATWSVEKVADIAGLSVPEGKVTTLRRVDSSAGMVLNAPKGLAILDGIEVLDDGSLVVTDFASGKVCAVTPCRQKVYTLTTLETPADLGLNRAKGLLYIPELTKSRAAVYRLSSNATNP